MLYEVITKKIYEDGTLGVKEEDLFERPESGNFDFDCVDIAGQQKQEESRGYIDSELY